MSMAEEEHARTKAKVDEQGETSWRFLSYQLRFNKISNLTHQVHPGYDLEISTLFNLAMLACQAWRFWPAPDLCAYF
jgi:hypothetical protein